MTGTPFLARLPPHDAAAPFHLSELHFQRMDSSSDISPVGFQLGFTRASGADAAALTGEDIASTDQLGESVFLLCKLDL